PKGVNTWGIVWQHNTQRLSAGIKTQRAALDLAEATVENFPIDVSGESSDHITGFRKHAVNLCHIPARECVRHACGCGSLSHIIFGRLRGVAQREGIVEKVF